MPARTASLVGTTTSVDPKTLHTFHRNPRRGDVAVIAASLRAHGQYKPITVNLGTHTGRANEVLAGNHTLMAFRDLREAEPELFQEIKVHWVDVDDDMCNRIVLADNRTSELGGMDLEQLHDILSSLEDADLTGTGYDTDYLKMLEEVTGGPPSLDDLADEHGDPLPGDGNETVRLSLSPMLAQQWNDHRRDYSSDDLALSALLNV